MNIGLDIDEVVCELVPKILDSMSQSWGISNTIDVFSNYNFFENLYTSCDKTNEAIAHDIVKWVNDPDYLYNTKPFPGTELFIRNLMAQGHEIHFITARPELSAQATKEWLDHFNIPYTSVHIIGLGACKGQIGRDLNLDVYVDDHAGNVDAMVKFTKALNFLIDRPWNRCYTNKKVVRVSKLQDIEEYL